MLILWDQYLGRVENVNELFQTKSIENNDPLYFGFMTGLGFWYKKVHVITSLIICTTSSLANIFNLWIFSKPGMRTPSNKILRALAATGLLKMVEYTSYMLIEKLWMDQNHSILLNTYSWAIFKLGHFIFSQILHTAATLLIITLTIWRLIMATRVDGKVWYTTERAKWSIVVAYLSGLILNIPLFLGVSISETKYRNVEDALMGANNTSGQSTMDERSSNEWDANQTIQGVQMYTLDVDLQFLPILEPLIFWFYSVFIKLLPCSVLAITSILIVSTLLSMKKQKEKMFGKIPLQCTSTSSTGNTVKSQDILPTTVRNFVTEINAIQRAVNAIGAICVLFLVSEFPPGLLALLSGILGESFLKSCYMPLSEFLDVLALLNTALSVNLICGTCQEYRKILAGLFRRKEASNPSINV